MQFRPLAMLVILPFTLATATLWGQSPARRGYPSGSVLSAPQAAKYTMNSRDFDIPVTIDQTGARPTEVRLYVSSDQGRRWTVAARSEPSQRQFQFNAPDDGVYWFATRTLDAAGRAYPPGENINPQLIVVVDTAQPELQVRADADATGTVTIDYVIGEQGLSAAGVQLLYVTDNDQTQWKPIEANLATANRDAKGYLHNRLQFQPNNAWRFLNLRMVVTDQAGNQAIVNKQIQRPRIASTPAHLAATGPHYAQPPVTPASQPLAQSPQHVQAPASLQTAPPPTGDYGYSMSLPAPPPAPAAQPSSALANQPASQPALRTPATPDAAYRSWQPAPPTANYVENQAPATYRGFAQSGFAAKPGNPQPVPAHTVSNSRENEFGNHDFGTPPMQPSAGGGTDNGLPTPTSQAMRPLEVETLPPPIGVPDAPGNVASTTAGKAPNFPQQSPNLLDQPTAQTVAQTTPNNSVDVDLSQVRQTRMNRFELNYEIESIGAQGVAAVELWGSRDGGKTWTNWGRDEDNQSPFDVETSGSGLYGFRIVVVGRNGLTSPPPHPGDEAEIYVLVDTEAPTAHINAARYGEGPEAGSLVIEYECQDDNLIDRPISLSYSDQPAGPWTTIAAGLENTGRYAWPADPRLPRQVYLRIEATDRAGNVGIESTSKSINVHGLAPRAHIRSFQPIAN